MNRARFIGLVVGAGLIVAVILISLGFNAAPEALGSGIPVVGMGDLRRVEAQGSSSAYAGMGDLRRTEFQTIGAAYAGMGDLHRFESPLPEEQKYQVKKGR